MRVGLRLARGVVRHALSPRTTAGAPGAPPQATALRTVCSRGDPDGLRARPRPRGQQAAPGALLGVRTRRFERPERYAGGTGAVLRHSLRESQIGPWQKVQISMLGVVGSKVQAKCLAGCSVSVWRAWQVFGGRLCECVQVFRECLALGLNRGQNLIIFKSLHM